MTDDMNNVEAEVNWGPPIPVDGKRPEWLAEDQPIVMFDPQAAKVGGGSTGDGWYGTASTVFYGRDIGSDETMIRLPANHPYYTRTPTIPAVLVEQCLGLVRDVAHRYDNGSAEYEAIGRDAMDWMRSAVAIVADPGFPVEVDPDLVEARKLAAAWSDREDVSHADYLNGELDFGGEVRGMVAALRRGRALERGES